MENHEIGIKKLTSIILIVCLVCLAAVGCAKDPKKDLQVSAAKALQKTVQYYENKGELGYWEEIIAMYGAAKSDESAAKWKDWKLPDIPKSDGRAVSLAGTILLQAGEGVFDGQSVRKLAALQNPIQGNFQSDFINQHIWAMIAMNVGGGTESYDYSAAVKYLLTFQGSDGGFGYDPNRNSTSGSDGTSGSDSTPSSDTSGNSDTSGSDSASGNSDTSGSNSASSNGADVSDPDLSGIAAVALAPYYKEHGRELGNKDSRKKLAGYFRESQTSDGGYAGMAGENPSTISSVIWGIYALGQDLPKSKDGKTPLDALLSFQNSDGSFHQQQDDNKGDFIATRQAAIALSDIANGSETYQLLAEDMQHVRQNITSGSAITFTIDYPKESKQKNVESLEMTLQKGETPLDALQNYGKENRIAVVQKDGYVTGINGISEKDYGPQSGWVYLVNGKIPGVAANAQPLKSKDHLEWKYVTSTQDIKDISSDASGSAVSK